MATAVIGRRRLVAVSLGATAARAEEALPPIRIGVLGDRSGTGAVTSGPDQVAAARLAAADFGRLSRGYPVDIIAAEFERRPDQAGLIARKWFDEERVAAIVDIPGTAAPVLVQSLARTAGRTVMNTGSFNAALTGMSCSSAATHWMDDTRALTMAMTLGMAAEGVKTWFLVVPDDVTGLAFQTDATAAIESTNGRVVGFARHPADSISFTLGLTNARESGADAIGLCAVGGPLAALVRQARALGLFERIRCVCAYSASIRDIHALGAADARDLWIVTGFYWNRNERTRAFAERFISVTDRMPDKPHAATYAAVEHFLRLVETSDTIDGAILNLGIRREPPYFFGGSGRFRTDGRLMLDIGLYRVKSPNRLDLAWDYYTPVRTIPATDAFRRPARGGCALPL